MAYGASNCLNAFHETVNASGSAKMARTLQGFVDTTSLHGPAEIYYAKSSAERLYWSVIFAAMVSIGTFFIYTVFVSYLEAPITTVVTTVDVKNMLLPEVAICYSGAIDAGKLLKNGLSKQAVRAVHKQFVYGGRSVETATWSEAIDSLKAVKPEILNFMTNRNISGYGDFIEYASFNCSQVIHEYNQFEQSNASDNSWKILKAAHHRHYGTCCILPRISQYYPFAYGGWTILLKAPMEEDFVKDLRYTRSFALEIAEKYEGWAADSYKLPLNRTVAISLQPTKYNRLLNRQWPRSNVARCHIRSENKFYLNCPDYCYTRQVLEQCNCSPLNIQNGTIGTKHENRALCWPDVEFDCAPTLAQNVFDTCRETCLPLCVETEYGVVVSYADFGAEQTITELGLTGSTQGVIHVQIGYNAMRYTSIAEQDTSGLDSCVSDIGGMFGLWLGGSIFTIIHLLTSLCGCPRPKTLTLATPSGADRTVETTQSLGVKTTSRKEDLQSDTCIKIDLEAGFEIQALQQCG